MVFAGNSDFLKHYMFAVFFYNYNNIFVLLLNVNNTALSGKPLEKNTSSLVVMVFMLLGKLRIKNLVLKTIK